MGKEQEGNGEKQGQRGNVGTTAVEDGELDDYDCGGNGEEKGPTVRIVS